MGRICDKTKNMKPHFISNFVLEKDTAKQFQTFSRTVFRPYGGPLPKAMFGISLFTRDFPPKESLVAKWKDHTEFESRNGFNADGSHYEIIWKNMGSFPTKGGGGGPPKKIGNRTFI